MKKKKIIISVLKINKKCIENKLKFNEGSLLTVAHIKEEKFYSYVFFIKIENTCSKQNDIQ